MPFLYKFFEVWKPLDVKSPSFPCKRLIAGVYVSCCRVVGGD